MQLNERYCGIFSISFSWFWASSQIWFNIFSYFVCSWKITFLVLVLQAISCTRSSINGHIDSSPNSQFTSKTMQKDPTGQSSPSMSWLQSCGLQMISIVVTWKHWNPCRCLQMHQPRRRKQIFLPLWVSTRIAGTARSRQRGKQQKDMDLVYCLPVHCFSFLSKQSFILEFEGKRQDVFK